MDKVQSIYIFEVNPVLEEDDLTHDCQVRDNIDIKPRIRNFQNKTVPMQNFPIPQFSILPPPTHT